MTARSRAVTFIASPEVMEFLNSLESGLKSKVINRALSHYIEIVDPEDVLSVRKSQDAEPPSPYKSSIINDLMDFAKWLEEREDRLDKTYSLVASDEKNVRLTFLLKKYGQRKKSKFGQFLDYAAELEEQED
jgi:hypothetical protein